MKGEEVFSGLRAMAVIRMNGASVHMGLGVSKGQLRSCQGRALAWGSVLRPRSSWGEPDEQWRGPARDTVETYHQCPSPPTKEGALSSLSMDPSVSPSSITTHCYPSYPQTKPGPRNQMSSARRLLEREADG